ncbi:MAG: TadE/TadG family type IV pilus assembly protein [Sphingomonas sp.]
MALEFALIIVPLAALMIAILQTSLAFFAQQTLETTAEKSVRQLMTGQAQQANMTQAQFKTLVCSKLPSFMTCSNVIVDVQSAASFGAVSTAPPTLTYDASGNITNSWKYTPGGAGAINVAKIMYIWSVQSGPLGFDISTMSSGKRLLIATAVFKTEPYA